MALQAHHHRNASQIESLLNPKVSPRKGTRDYVADNKRLVAEMQEIALARRAELESAASGGRRGVPAEYAHVESKLKAAGAMAAPEVDASALRSARRSTAAPAAIPARFVRKEVAAPKPAVPRAEVAPAASTPREPRDFVAHNTTAAVAAAAAAASAKRGSGKADDARHRAYGAVPDYLKDRQKQWAAAEEEKRVAAENADVPRGMRVMSDAEKAESIALLEASMADCAAELSRFKLRVELPSQVKRHAELEMKMKKMEDAMAIFRRPRVFVQLDA